jgi:hypothetical protein
METFEIPTGSKIKKENTQNGDVMIFWYKPDGGVFRYFIGLFLLAWMGGWFFGFKSAVGQLINKPDITNNSFLMFWLVGWTLGGCFASYYLYLILRPQKPERITVYADHLEYDTGTSPPAIAPFSGRFFYDPTAQWKKLFQKRKVFPNLLRGELKFVHDQNPSRLYFDWESNRYEIGTGLSEPDIDWLYSQVSGWSH